MSDKTVTSFGLPGIVTGLELKGSRVVVTVETLSDDFHIEPVALKQMVIVRPKVKDL